MAKNDQVKPDDVKTGPVNETQPEDGDKAPDLAAKEAAALAHEDTAATEKTGEQLPGPAAPSDLGGEHIPNPGDVVVPFPKTKEEKTVAQDSGPEEKPPIPDKKPRRGRPPKIADKADKGPISPDNRPEWEKSTAELEAEKKKTRKPRTPKQKPAAEKKAPEKAEVPPPEPKEAPRHDGQEQIVYLNLSELHAFKDHPFQVRDDEEMKAMVASVADKGVSQPAIVRPREDGGYEIVSGHRRQKASELAGYTDMPCIVRNLTDEEAITQMVEDNTNQREAILPSERAKALKMQLEAIKRQGSRADLSTTGQNGSKLENGQRSNAIVAERNKMTVKQVQRYIKLNDLVPDLLKMADEKKIAFTPAVELSFIGKKNQRYIAVAIEGQQSPPSLSQAQRMRELDQKNMLNPDVIDGIMLEEKKEADKVILSSQELSQYFGKDKTPREMKDTIIKLLDDWKGQQKDLAKPEKKVEQEK